MSRKEKHLLPAHSANSAHRPGQALGTGGGSGGSAPQRACCSGEPVTQQRSEPRGWKALQQAGSVLRGAPRKNTSRRPRERERGLKAEPGGLGKGGPMEEGGTEGGKQRRGAGREETAVRAGRRRSVRPPGMHITLLPFGAIMLGAAGDFRAPVSAPTCVQLPGVHTRERNAGPQRAAADHRPPPPPAAPGPRQQDRRRAPASRVPQAERMLSVPPDAAASFHLKRALCPARAGPDRPLGGRHPSRPPPGKDCPCPRARGPHVRVLTLTPPSALSRAPSPRALPTTPPGVSTCASPHETPTACRALHGHCAQDVT